MAWGLPAAQVHDAGYTAGASADLGVGVRQRAVRTVLRNAVSAGDALRLDQLGLSPVEGIGEGNAS